MATTEFPATSLPGQYLRHSLESGQIKPGALVILDLDDTTITTPEGQWLGRSEMFYHMVDQETRRNPDKDRMEIVREIDALLRLVYPHTRVQLTDPELPETIDNLKARGIKVIGMTARGLSLTDITLGQLRRTGITFSDTGPLRTIPLNGTKQVRIDKGVVFSGQANTKGDTLLALQANKVLNIPGQVILLDDHQRHLVSVMKALENYGSEVKYQPVLCTYLADKKTFNPEESEQQLLAFLYERRNDAEISGMIQKSPFSQSWIRRCQNSPVANREHCETLVRQLDRH